MSRRTAPGQTAVDYVTIVLSPLLIMGLVGSLVFFLLEVFYRSDGAFKERLQWVLFFFVFGMVLVARISMRSDIASRFWIYGAVLSLLTYLGMHLFVEYPEEIRTLAVPINLVLIVVVWWCSHRLTWDCTNVDEDTDLSGQGVLQAAGLEAQPPARPDEAQQEKEQPASWWQRFQRYREQRRKKRTLGVWVVYFSLAALPIFGLGQALIPLTAPERRAFTFWLMTVYVACGLGLLLTTCFLGLRRYLRQKGLQMPAAMTGVWLTSGAVVVVVLLVLGALLPRPSAEYSLLDVIDPAGSPQRKASRLAFKGDSPAEDRGQPGATRPDGKEPGGKTDAGGKAPGQEKDGKAPGQEKDGKGQSDSPSSKDSTSGEKNKERGKADGDRQDQPRDGQKDEQRGGGRRARDEQGGAKHQARQGQGKKSGPSPRLAGVQQFLQRIGPWLKWIVFAVLAGLVVLALLRGGLGFLANFTSWARQLLDAWRRFWAALFGRRRENDSAAGAEDSLAEQAERVVPFSAFANPFETGRAERMTPRQLVRYSFEALEAWARERDLARQAGETALEFAQRLGNEVPALEAPAQQLAQLLARAEYARGELPTSTTAVLRHFWERLQRLVEAPLSA